MASKGSEGKGLPVSARNACRCCRDNTAYFFSGIRFQHDLMTPLFGPVGASYCAVPYRTVCVTPSWADFPCSISPQLEYSATGAKNGSALKASRRELSEDVSFAIGTLLVV